MKATKNGELELTGGQTQAELKIQKGIYLETHYCHCYDTAQSGNTGAGEGDYNFTKSQEKINHLMYMDDIKIFEQKNNMTKSKLEIPIQIYKQNIGMEFSIEKCAMIMKKVKRETKEGIKLPNHFLIR